MKKAIRTIALMLLICFTCSFCLTACDDDKKGSNKTYSQNFESKHTNELADVYLAYLGLEKGDDGYDDAQANAKAKIASLLSEETQQYLNVIGDNILKPSGLNDKKISDVLVKAANLLKAEQSAVDSLKEIYAGNEDLIAASSSLAEIADRTNLELSQMNPAQLVEFFMSNTDTFSDLLDIVIDTYPLLSEEEKAVAVQVLQNIVDKEVEFANSLDADVIAKIIINTITVDTSVIFGVKLEDVSEEFAAIKAQFNALGLNDKAKKAAYATVLASAIKGAIRTATVDYIEIADLLAVVDSISVVTSGDYTVAQFTEAVNNTQTLLGEIGKYVSATALTEKEQTALVNACKTLNASGLGYFANRFVPAENYMIEFEGVLLQNIDMNDMVLAGMDLYESGVVTATVDLAVAIVTETITKIMQSIFAPKQEAEVYYDGEVAEDPTAGEQEEAAPTIQELTENLFGIIFEGNDAYLSAIVVICNDVNVALNNYKNKNKFIAAVNTALGSNFATDLVNKIASLAGYYDEVVGNNNKSLTDARLETLYETYGELLNLVMLNVADFSAFDAAEESFMEYFAPVKNLVVFVREFLGGMFGEFDYGYDEDYNYDEDYYYEYEDEGDYNDESYS